MPKKMLVGALFLALFLGGCPAAIIGGGLVFTSGAIDKAHAVTTKIKIIKDRITR